MYLPMTDVLIIIFADILYFQNYQNSIFPQVWTLWKYANLKIVQILNSKIIGLLTEMYYLYVCMNVCRQT